MNMHEQHPEHSAPILCQLLGRSKQAYYQWLSASSREELQQDLILQEVDCIRLDLPRSGARKLYAELCKRLPAELCMGRDKFFDLLRANGYMLRRTQRSAPRTTDSRHRYHIYSNLAQDFVPTGPNQLYVSDITYLRTFSGYFFMLSLVTDTFSHKIVGWCLWETLDAEGPLQAMRMALEGLPEHSSLIHHSDRGTQYCCGKYIELLSSHGIAISMTQSGNPRENAIAERVNGILKSEWLNDMELVTIEQSRELVGKVIELYNTKRLHSSIGMLTPEQMHQNPQPARKLWKNYYTKREEVDGS